MATEAIIFNTTREVTCFSTTAEMKIHIFGHITAKDNVLKFIRDTTNASLGSEGLKAQKVSLPWSRHMYYSKDNQTNLTRK